MGVSEAVASRDERQALEAMSDSLAQAMDDAAPAVKAQLAGQLQKVLQRLAELGPVEEKVSALDDLSARRSRRQSKTQVG